jgi:hypothetical protein
VQFIDPVEAERLTEIAEYKAAASKSLYLNNDRDAFRRGNRKSEANSGAKAKKAPARPRFNIQLY